MKENMRRRIPAVLLAVLVAMTVLGACGNPNKKSTSPATAPGLSSATAVGLDRCTACHATQTADWLTTKHANLDPDGTLDSTGNPTLTEITGCTTRCHDPLRDSGRLVAGYTGNVARPVIGCESCHGGGSLHMDGGGGTGNMGFAALPAGKVGPTAVSAQFNTCTSCHQLLDSAGTGVATAEHATTAPTGAANVITDTHFATPLTYVTGVYQDVTGYVMDFSSESVCSDCHNPHGTAEVNKQWAQSAHADTTGSAAWAHYNWSTRQNCQRCHTTTGYIAYNTAIGKKDASQASLINTGTLASSPVTSSYTWAPEMLECRGCHVDNKGTLRNPGVSYTAPYDNYTVSGTTVTTYSRASFAYPDVSGSNVCLLCHTGRANGDTIKNLNQAGVTSADMGNFSFINDHHFTAAATVFGAGGYEYSSRSYEDPSYYVHKKIGTADVPNTGSNGPCAGCHMSTAEKHLFLPVGTTTGDVFGTITAVTSTICANCHTWSGGEALPMSAEMLERQKSYLADALSAVDKVMERGDLYKRPASTSIYRVRSLSLISAGTATVTNGSAVVTGQTTNWAETGLEPGDQFRMSSGGTWYDILSVDAANQITLTAAYAGTTVATGAAYEIRKAESVTVQNGNNVVTGIGTNWDFTTSDGTAAIFPGDQFRVDSEGTWYTISTVDAPTQITLTTAYLGSSATVSAFSIRNAAGLVSVNNASTAVTAVDVNWTALDVAKGDFFRVDTDGTWYTLASTPTVSTLTLTASYTGSTVAGGSYTIIRSTATRNWLNRGDGDLTGNTTGKNNMGACLNRVMLDPSQEPGAFAHNRYYVKRLLYDAIDWMDDGVLNYSTGATLTAIKNGSNPVWINGAISYLLPFGTFTNSSLERP